MSNYAQEQAERLVRLADQDGMSMADLRSASFVVTREGFVLMANEAARVGDMKSANKFASIALTLQQGIDTFNKQHDQREK